MLHVGDTVVTMSTPGRYTIIAIEGDHVTIQDARGVQKLVLAQALRRVGEVPAQSA